MIEKGVDLVMRSNEFVGIAEGIKSLELSTKDKIEKCKGKISELSETKQSLYNQISYLKANLEAAYAYTDEDGGRNYSRIAAIESQINYAESKLSEVETQLDIVNGELFQSQVELKNIIEDKTRTLSEIQERAKKTSQNIAFAGGMYGAYAGVGSTLQGSMQTSLASLSKAASILDGSVEDFSGTRSKGQGLTDVGSSSSQGGLRELSTSALSAFFEVFSCANQDNEILVNRSSSSQSNQVISNIKKINEFKQSTSVKGIFNDKSTENDFVGFHVKKSRYKEDIWNIVGSESSYNSYCKWRADINNYTSDKTRYNDGVIKEIDLNLIEGISISTAEINNPQIFWGGDSGKDMQSFVEIASHIPEVKSKLLMGYRLKDLENDPILGSCVNIYFDPERANAPTLLKGDGFYEFVGNGRHRILAARYLGYSFPIRVVGEIVKKNSFRLNNIDLDLSKIKNVSSTEELISIAQKYQISKNFDFGNLDLKVSQQIVESLIKTRNLFPNLNIDMNFVGSIQARNNYLIENATKELLYYYTTYYKDNNPTSSKEECKKYAVFQTKKKLSRLVPGENTIAQSISASSTSLLSGSDKILLNAAKGIAINESFGYSNSSFRKRKVEEVISGHKPHGCNTVKSTIDHEIGHQIANALNAQDDPYINFLYENFIRLSKIDQSFVLSTYAGEEKKIGEFLAECWSEYQNNPECRSMAKDVCNRMIEIYNANFSKDAH